MNNMVNEAVEDLKNSEVSGSEEIVLDRPGRVFRVVSDIAGEVETLRRVKAEQDHLENIQSSVALFNGFYDRHLHLIESSSDAEEKIEDLANKLSQNTEEVFERILKISIRNKEVQKELAADFYLDGKASEEDIRTIVSEDELEELKLAKE